MSKSYRLQYKFWLNVFNPAEEAVADIIERLKTRGLFTKTVRDGILIVSELREGKIDALLRLFPFVREAIIDDLKKTDGGGSGGDVNRQLEELTNMVASLTLTNHAPGGLLNKAHALTPPALSDSSMFVAATVADGVSAGEARATFSSGFGNLFTDDDDDLWDD